MARQFTCAYCGETFDSGWTEEEAQAEYEQNFPKSSAAEVPADLVCDDCYKALTDVLPPAEAEKDFERKFIDA